MASATQSAPLAPTHSSAAAPASTSKSSSSSSSWETPAQIYKEWQANMYPDMMWWFLGALIGAITIIHLGNVLLSKKRTDELASKKPSVQRGKDEEDTAPSRPYTTPSIRRVPQAALTAWRVVLYRLTFPILNMNLAELLFTMAYFGAILIWALVRSNDAEPPFWANRVAVLATSQVPLIIGLAGKNNVISFLTGIGPERLNVLHRAAGRSCLMLLWMHFYGRATQGLYVFYAPITDPSIQWGAVGLGAFTLTAILGLRPIRRIAYEFFLLSHITLILLFLVAGCIHQPQFNYRIWPGFILWGLDRTCRFLRLIILNKLWLSVVPRKHTEMNHVTVERISADTIRLKLRRHMSWKAGQHVYLVLPTISRFPLEAHPFTPASISHSLDGTDGPAEKELTFIIRARDGLTGRLLRHVIEFGSKPVPSFIDGPYGCAPNLVLNDTCVLIAGGSGVSYTIALLLDLVYHARNNTSAVRKVVFIWAIRDRAHLAWIATSLASAIACAPSTLELDIRIFVTQPDAHPLVLPKLGGDTLDSPVTPLESSVDVESEKKPPRVVEISSFSDIRHEGGRPDLKKILKEEIELARGPVSVDVSGPAALARGVRAALRSPEVAGPGGVLRGKPTVALHTEAFGW